jgi:hypothetical protein
VERMLRDAVFPRPPFFWSRLLQTIYLVLSAAGCTPGLPLQERSAAIEGLGSV